MKQQGRFHHGKGQGSLPTPNQWAIAEPKSGPPDVDERRFVVGGGDVDTDPAADNAINAARSVARMKQEFPVLDMKQPAAFEDG